MPPVLDHIFEFVGRYVVSSRSKTRFFHEGWGDLALARDVSRRSRAYFAPNGNGDDECIKSARAHRARGVDIRWSAVTTAESGYGRNILRQDAAFESPFADSLPEESRLVRFARLRPDDAATTTGRETDAIARTRRIAVLLPCTGDVDEWFRRSIARDLLAEGVECVIPTIAYYGARKPEAQWRHVLRSVAEAKIQLSVTPVEMMLLSRALMREAEDDGEDAREGSQGPPRLSPEKLQRVRVLLLGHQGRARGIGVRHADVPELGGGVHDEVLCPPRQVGHDHGGAEYGLDHPVPVRHGIHAVGAHPVEEAQVLGHDLPVHAEGVAGEGARPEREPRDRILQRTTRGGAGVTRRQIAVR